MTCRTARVHAKVYIKKTNIWFQIKLFYNADTGINDWNELKLVNLSEKTAFRKKLTLPGTLSGAAGIEVV